MKCELRNLQNKLEYVILKTDYNIFRKYKIKRKFEIRNAHYCLDLPPCSNSAL